MLISINTLSLFLLRSGNYTPEFLLLQKFSILNLHNTQLSPIKRSILNRLSLTSILLAATYNLVATEPRTSAWIPVVILPTLLRRVLSQEGSSKTVKLFKFLVVKCLVNFSVYLLSGTAIEFECLPLFCIILIT
jgi:hypothetical protein